MREGSCSSEPVLLTISAAEQHFVSCRAGLRSHHKIQRLGKVSPETVANRKNVLLGIKPPKICYAVFDLNRKFCLSFHFPHPAFRPALHPTPTSRRNSFNRGGDRQHLLHLTAHGQHCVRRAGPRGLAAQLSSALPATPRPQGLRLWGLCCPRHAASVARGLGGMRPRCQAAVHGVCETPHDTAFEAKSTRSVSGSGRVCDAAPPSASGVPRSDSGSGGDTGVAVALSAAGSIGFFPRFPGRPTIQCSNSAI